MHTRPEGTNACLFFITLLRVRERVRAQVLLQKTDAAAGERGKNSGRTHRPEVLLHALRDDAAHADDMLVRKERQAGDDRLRVERQALQLLSKVPSERVGVLADVGRRAEFAFLEGRRGSGSGRRRRR
jgi:hypothetical protein